MNKITEVSSESLPNSLKAFENIRQLALLAAEEMNGISEKIKLDLIWSRIDELSEKMLDTLAYDLHIDWYDYDYSIDQKRNVIKTSIAVHKKLGTRYAVETALRAVYPHSAIKAWYEDGGSGEPYTFDVVLDMSQSEAAVPFHRVNKIVHYYKSLRDRVGNTQFVTKLEHGCYVGSIAKKRVFCNVAPLADDIDTVLFHKAYVGLFCVTRKNEVLKCEIIAPTPSGDELRGVMRVSGRIDSGIRGQASEIDL